MEEVDRPVLSPGICFNCRGSEKEGLRWFDTQKEPWKVGRMYLCSACVENLAVQLEIHPNIELQKRIEELEVENVAGNHALGVLSDMRTAFESLDSKPVADEQIITGRTKGAKESAA